MKNEVRGDIILLTLTVVCLFAADLTDTPWLALLALPLVTIFCIKSHFWLKATMNQFDSDQKRLEESLEALKKNLETKD